MPASSACWEWRVSGARDKMMLKTSKKKKSPKHFQCSVCPFLLVVAPTPNNTCPERNAVVTV